MYLLNEPTQDLPLQSIRPSLPGSSCLIFLLLSILDTTQLEVIQRNGDIYIHTLPYVEASGLPTSTNLLYLRWMTTAASSLLQRPRVHGPQMFFGSFDFFLSGGRCAQRGRRTCRPAADRKDRTADHFLFHPGRGGRGHLAPHVVSGGREIFSCAIFELPCGYFSRLCSPQHRQYWGYRRFPGSIGVPLGR